MYRNNFVLAIKDSNGNTLRENSSGNVFLPFDSEYKIFLKNNALTRALVADGNLNSGRKFKFVSLNSPAVSNPSSSENGVVEVFVRYEKLNYYTTTCTPIWQFSTFRPLNTQWFSPTYTDTGSSTCYRSSAVSSNFVSSCGIAPQGSQVSQSQKGATVEGGVSSQAFTTTIMGELESDTTVLRLHIVAPLGINTPVIVSDTKKVFCSTCRAKVRWNDSFCWKCGEKLIHNDMVA
jgi:hypothetical protein